MAAGVAGAGGYLFAPAQKADPISEEAPEVKVAPAQANEDEDTFEGGEFVPQELTPQDKFVQGLTEMKTLRGDAFASIGINNYDVELKINDVYLTLEELSLDKIELSVDATVTFMDKDFDIDVTFANNTLYLSALGNDLKLATSDFSQIKDMVSSLGLPEIALPNEITSLSLESIQTKLAAMPYEHTQEGYTFSLSLFESAPIIFKCDEDFNFTYLEVDGLSLLGMKMSLVANVSTTKEIVTPVAIPETVDRKFTNFSDILPLAKHIGDLINQKQFAISLNGSIIDEGEESGITFSGATQFDLDKKTGAGRIHIIEHEYQDENGDNYTHDLALDISNEDVIFDYNSTIKGRLEFASLKDIIDLINSLMGDLGTELPTSVDGLASLIEGTVLASVLDGHYEALADDVFKNIELREDHVSLTLDKKFLGLEEDINIAINFTKEKLIGVSISNIVFEGRHINLNLSLDEYDSSFDSGIDRTNIEQYSNCANLVPLVKGISKLVAQKKFALGVTGSLKKEGQAIGLTFDGSTQFNLETHSGDGVISITENESTYSKKPVHTIRVGVNEQDVRISYNDKLNAKFTIQTVKDIFNIVTDLMSDQESRVYQWFGEKIDTMNETILMRVINGEYGLLFHNIIKDVSLSDSQLDITIAGKIFNLEDDITLSIGFEDENITFVHLVNFEAIGYVVDLRVNVLEWSDSYATLPEDTGSNYYDMSDLKTLAQLGLNVANLDYFHIKGTATIDMTAIGLDLGDLADMKNLPIEVEVFENNGEVGIKAMLSGIPTLVNGNIASTAFYHTFGNPPKSSLEFYYENGYFYMTRHSYNHEWFHYVEIEDSIKTDKEDFTSHIMEYILGWGMRLKESSTIWKSINGSMQEHKDRTEAMDYASLLTNYSYKNDSTSEYGNHEWGIGLNIAELANNSDLKSLDATIYGKNMEFTDPETGDKINKDYLTHLDASIRIEASVLKLTIDASLNLIDIDPFLTYEELTTSSLTSESYAQFKSYINSHPTLKPVSF